VPAMNKAAPNPTITICIRIFVWNFIAPSTSPFSQFAEMPQRTATQLPTMSRNKIVARLEQIPENTILS
jgi:hypothetical protein